MALLSFVRTYEKVYFCKVLFLFSLFYWYGYTHQCFPMSSLHIFAIYLLTAANILNNSFSVKLNGYFISNCFPFQCDSLFIACCPTLSINPEYILFLQMYSMSFNSSIFKSFQYTLSMVTLTSFAHRKYLPL